jgi:hypothetical protein
MWQQHTSVRELTEKVEGHECRYIFITHFYHLIYSVIWQKINSLVTEQSDLTARNTTELCLLPASCWFLTWPILWPWRWRQYFLLLKRLWPSATLLHGIMYEKIQLFTGFVCHLNLAGLFLISLFDPEDGGSTFHRNISGLLLGYMTLCSVRQYSSYPRRQHP